MVKSRYVDVSVDAEVEVDLSDYFDDFIDMVCDDANALEQVERALAKKHGKQTSLVNTKQPIFIPASPDSQKLSGSEMLLHSKIRCREREYLNLNTVLLKEGKLAGVISTDGHFMLLTSFIQMREIIEGFNSFTKHCVSKFIPEINSEIAGEIFFHEDKLLTNVIVKPFTVEPVFRSQESFTLPDFSKLLKIDFMDKKEDFDINGLEYDTDGDMVIKNRFFKRGFIDLIKDLYQNKVGLYLPEEPSVAIALSDERNLLMMMPRRK